MFIHIDMDYFFAQVEEKRHPESKGKIIVVCIYSGRTADSGAVSSVSYAGRALGIHAGMPIVFAKKLIKPEQALFLSADREHYAEVSAQIDSFVRTQFQHVVQMSIDEWNCENEDDDFVRGKGASAQEKAKQLKNQIREHLGFACSIGVASSLIGAKMAASKSKPNGFLVLDKKLERMLIGSSNVEKVPGVGPKTAEALKALGVVDVDDLAKIYPLVLVETFGRKTGSWLQKLGKGEYDGELGQDKEQEGLSRIGTLKAVTRDPDAIIAKLLILSKEAKERLMGMRKSYKTLSVIFITEDLHIHTKSMTFRNPRSWSEDTSKEEKELLLGFLAGERLGIRRIGIRFGSFLDLGGQMTLF